MPEIYVRCPHCDAILGVEDSVAAAGIDCPKCRGTSVIPSYSRITAQVVDDEQDWDDEYYEQEDHLPESPVTRAPSKPQSDSNVFSALGTMAFGGFMFFVGAKGFGIVLFVIGVVNLIQAANNKND